MSVLDSIGAFFAAAAAWAGLAGGGGDALRFQGYVEAEYVRPAAPVGGTLETLSVRRGDTVAAGAPLFALNATIERAAYDESVARLQQAEAQLADLRKGKRETEMRAIEAQRAQAEAALRLSESQLRRQEVLAAQNIAAKSSLDEARSAAQRDRARVAELNAEWRTATLGGRTDAVQAAAMAVEMANAEVSRAARRLAEIAPPAPADALVFDTYFRPGEFVPAGAPVLALLPPGNVKVRFFVPEPRLGFVSVGERVAIACDGCAGGMTARVSYVAPAAEFTPPVIYSIESRAKLVFLVEAVPESAPARLHPGQPVDVTLRGNGR